MPLINVPDIQNLDPATPELFNSRYGTIVDLLNGNLDDANMVNGAVTTAKLANDAVTGAKIQLANNEDLESLNASANPQSLLKLHTDGYLRLSQLPHQANTTDTTQTNVLIQSGWGFIQGTGASFSSKIVTFPTAFTTLLAVVVNNIGFKDSSDPSGITDFGNWEHPNVNAGTPTLTGFTAYVGTTDGSAIASGRRIGFSWIAFGLKT